MWFETVVVSAAEHWMLVEAVVEEAAVAEASVVEASLVF